MFSNFAKQFPIEMPTFDAKIRSNDNFTDTIINDIRQFVIEFVTITD